MLLLLIENSARVVTKEELWEEVWHGTFTSDNNINVHIAKIRKALSQSRDGHQCIETIEKQGFRCVERAGKHECSLSILVARWQVYLF